MKVATPCKRPDTKQAANEAGLAALLPRRVAVAAARADIDDALLFAEEEAAVGRAVDTRRREFATGRACARTALAQLGIEPVAIPSGPQGAPHWPPGVVGSITHCRGYRACAVAHEADVAAIGIDAEPNQPLPRRVLETIATFRERQQLQDLATTHPQVRWDRLLFSAKESVYKAWFSITGRRANFEDIVLAIEPDAHVFSANLQNHAQSRWRKKGLQSFAGRWTISDGVILTAISIASRTAVDVTS